MRFQFLKPRKDIASAEQVRAAREARGWTMEQMADGVHASALEVSAWEAGAVAVPSKQALLIRWLTDVDAWRAALDDAHGQSCAWVPEHAPDLYERMFRVPERPWWAGSTPAGAHALLFSLFAGRASLGPDFDLAPMLSGIQVPALVIHGAGDAIPLASTAGYADALPNGKLLVMDGSGHFPWLEEPTEFFAAVNTYLRRGNL